MNGEHAKKHSLDISHVTAVELPLIVRNPNKVIEMLGGKDRIRKAVNSQYRQSPLQPSSHSVDERNLELRLRQDPFHHPIQASANRREKILLKVRIPKSSLPSDYHDHPEKYTVRELLDRNTKLMGPSYLVEPVSIINKNYNFRAIADFQMSTKNNETVQKFNTNLLYSKKFEDTKKYYLENLTNKSEYKDPSLYENKDHHLIPPPHFSGVRFPFDYKYKKSPYTVTLRDDNGNARVVMKSDSKKLFTNTVDYHGNSIPDRPLPEIISKYEWLLNTDLSKEYADKKLFDCIQCLKELFELKPIWLRKSLIDVVPDQLKSAVKEALPYVSYCYKNGPWRFCNVKLGINPKDDKSYWVYQSEYFRLQGLHNKSENTFSKKSIVPQTISVRHPESTVQLSEDLFFTGIKLPKAINYQIGDILDRDIIAVVQKAQNTNPSLFFRDTVDPQDGWVQKQIIETIRKIIRYKLRRLQREEPIEADKVLKIINTDHTIKVEARKDGEHDDDDEEEEDAEEEEESGANLEEEEDMGDEDMIENDDDEALEEASKGEANIEDAISEEFVTNRVKQVDEHTASKLLAFVGMIKQDALNAP